MFEKIKGMFSTKNSDGKVTFSLNKTKGKAMNFLIALLRYAVLISISYIVLYPVLYMLSSSFKALSDFSDPTIYWIPKHFTTQWMTWAINALDYLNAFKNTVLFEMVAAVLEIFSCSLVAYGLARFDFKGKKIFLGLLILTIIVPDQMIIIPKIVNFSNLDFLGIISLINKVFGQNIRINVLNTGFAFYLPSILAIGLRSGIIMFIYMQFYKGLPRELEEAAWIDGAGLFKTYLRIALPSSGVVITTVSIFSMIWHWNDYYLAVMFMNKASAMPLAVKLSNIGSVLPTLYNCWGGNPMIATKSAASILFILPMLIMYIILQRKFVKSIDRVGITG